jgi:hypothetical protein
MGVGRVGYDHALDASGASLSPLAYADPRAKASHRSSVSGTGNSGHGPHLFDGSFEYEGLQVSPTSTPDFFLCFFLCFFLSFFLPIFLSFFLCHLFVCLFPIQR